MHRCEWCGTDSKNATCGSAHRGARWRFLRDIGNDEPPWVSSPLHGRRGELDPAARVAAEAMAEEARVERQRDEALAAAERAQADLEAATAPGPRSGSNARSGLILSYSKAVEAAQDALATHVIIASGCSREEARAEIENALRGALSDKMRSKLEARDAA